MSLLRGRLNGSGSNIKGSPIDLETLSTLVDHDNFGERVELPAPQTPPLDITSPSQHRRMQPQQQNHEEERMRVSINADPIPQPTMLQVNTDPGKMLAHPIPSLRPTDINRHRESGYMGINPVTLVGETGLLPGSWGQGKEFVDVMARHEPRKWPAGKDPVAYRNDARMQLQNKVDQVIVDTNELRTQYARAILDGGACVESSSNGSYLTMAMQSGKETWAKECNGVGDDFGGGEEVGDEWLDISEDEEDTGGVENESGHKRDDSGYASGKPESRSRKSPAAVPVMCRGKRVRFGEEASDKERKACKLPRPQ